MKKQIIIESCAECPYTFEDQHGLWCSLNPKIRVGDVLIPSNCPLEDAE